MPSSVPNTGLSEPAELLAARLRALVGPGCTGIGPDAAQLLMIWEGEEPARLRPAVEELAAMGFVDVERSAQEPEEDPELLAVLDGIAGVVVLEPLQNWFGNAAF